MKRLALLILLLVATVSPTASQSKRTNDARIDRELRTLTRQWDEALVTKNINTLNQILATEFVITGLPKTTYLALIKIPELKYSSAKKKEIKARVYGNTAVLFGRNEITGTYTGADSFSSVFDFMDVWVKRDGRWRCVAEFSNRIRDEEAEKQHMVPIGPDVRADLVIFFKVAASHDEIESFWEQTLSTRSEKGHWPRPGIRDIMRLFAVQDHEAIAVTFFPDATQAQRDDIRARVKSSPLVFKVMEDVVPQDIKSIEEPTLTPIDLTSAPDSELQQHLGARVTIRGQFSLRGKVGPFILVAGRPIYLVPKGTFSWGVAYASMEGKEVRVTGTLRFAHYPVSPAEALPEGRPANHFYFEAETAKVELSQR